MPYSLVILRSSSKSFLFPIRPESTHKYILACPQFWPFPPARPASSQSLWNFQGRSGRIPAALFMRLGNIGAWLIGSASLPRCPRCLAGFIRQIWLLSFFIGRHRRAWARGSFWRCLLYSAWWWKSCRLLRCRRGQVWLPSCRHWVSAKPCFWWAKCLPFIF